jgi:hypothetical protein
MKKNFKFVSFFMLLPLVVGVQNANNDSTETNFKIAGGLGSYAYITRGCEGEVLTKEEIPFKDAGFSFDHKFRSPVKIGLRGGYIWDNRDRATEYIDWIDTLIIVENSDNFYLNPDLSFEGRWFGIGAGPFFAQKTLYGREGGEWGKSLPSWHIRIGSKKGYFSMNMLENIPLYSGGGYLNLGVGGSASPNFSYWIGLGSSGPYDNVGFIAKTDIRLKSNLYLDLAGRLGTSEGVSESAISAGLNYRVFGRK